ncbi:hypothetical protein DB30_04973 [Enhygromyxa salina]|uniref:Uncharacterized protein n=1 Tax=Enhygromyxa salina TaxID=215803 RepID=A0A0C2CYN8_9BACT|nr:hypothetical protein DB30_04973 [Enhygromyxa salina]
MDRMWAAESGLTLVGCVGSEIDCLGIANVESQAFGAGVIARDDLRGEVTGLLADDNSSFRA